MPPFQSEVWKYFTRSTDKKTAKCKLCSIELTYTGGTTNLRNHLRIKHPTTSADENELKQKQLPMTAFIRTPKKVTVSESEQLTQAIVEMVVKDYVPISIVEGVGFRKLMQLAVPDFKVPGRNTVRSRIVKRYEEEKKALCSELMDVSSASITTDTWTSNSTESYITVTEHHINNEWEMKSNVLMTRAMPERHTGENIAKKLKDCVSEFCLDNIDTCVHDNARNMECAGGMCEQWGDLGCFGHTLQLCIKPALELPTVAKTVSKCRKLVGHFKHSTTVTSEMKKRQKLFGEPEHCLIQDVPTRWNSTQMMMERLTSQRRVITDIMLDSKVTKKNDASLLLKDHEWDVISALSDVLEVLTDVTTYMCTERDVSCSEIYPIVCGLLNGCLKNESDDSSLTSKVKETIRDQLLRRFKPYSLEAARTTPVLASLLDPRYKRLPFLSKEQRNIAEDMLESRIDDVPLKVTPRDITKPTASKRRKLDFLTYETPEDDSSDELQSYIAEKLNPDVKPLEWWKQNEAKFPKIAIIAKAVLATPASSVPSERIFSTAGLLINKLRNRLSSGIVDSIIFLNKNRIQQLDD